ncbi:phosphoribosylformylglycinamidine synthase subunit PurS [Vagococcus penaei]|uniref:Phosphoribosylformylglycinamidine synthase subunit PurS n=1 Tax=Vagococcus penaei TaxID=633807 RepID=A0A1Q2D4D6_9ENTE|nr:phosphoribosylformylglycinamidine synthase subunit PurS [Vagococcus penaei]AQP53270.1 phosphoribosylformylglycinamidine synthase [Vagococcus penaei]RSU04038.1 phosphoribosylformylglycinamidine synthase subunit PurS [Vagococcus penaei]
MYHVNVYVSYKESILDPQVEVITKAMNRLGFGQIEKLKLGKQFDFELAGTSIEEVEIAANQLCDQLLANINMESYRIHITEVN